jgi:hypothetical protein
MSLHCKPVIGQKPFIVTQFTCFEDPKTGKCSTVPLVPITACPTGIESHDSSLHCEVTIFRERKRKHPRNMTVLVMYFATHDLYFTAYPVGYTPYGRQPLVELDSLGSEIAGENGSSPRPASLESYDIAVAELAFTTEPSNAKDSEIGIETDDWSVSDTESHLIPTFFLQS